MTDQTNTRLSFFLFAAAVMTAGCGYNQHTKFQMSFLPPAPKPLPGEVVELAPPPVVESNLFLESTPAFLLANTEAALKKSRTDATLANATLRFQRGRSFYQKNDISNARREFDAAI